MSEATPNNSLEQLWGTHGFPPIDRGEIFRKELYDAMEEIPMWADIEKGVRQLARSEIRFPGPTDLADAIKLCRRESIKQAHAEASAAMTVGSCTKCVEGWLDRDRACDCPQGAAEKSWIEGTVEERKVIMKANREKAGLNY